MIELTAQQASDALARGDFSSRELFDAYRERAAGDELNAFVWVADGAPDAEGVPPTSHVVDVANALRPDEPRPCLDREVALANAPARTEDGFLVPSPQAA